jgi:hypothetical protein
MRAISKSFDCGILTSTFPMTAARHVDHAQCDLALQTGPRMVNYRALHPNSCDLAERHTGVDRGTKLGSRLD